MKKIILIFLIVGQISNLKAIEPTAELFTYDEEKIAEKFKELSELEAIVKENPTATLAEIHELCPYFKNNNQSSVITPYSFAEINAPGNFPSFWFTFTFSAIGFYFFPYGAAAAPISVGIVYFSSKKDKTETKKALWGCVVGSILGGGIKYVVLNGL
jgi:hypothetical protein